MKTAQSFLAESMAIIHRRGEDRGMDDERNMKRIVDTFNSLTGKALSEADGWSFMLCLKMVRAQSGTFHEDDYKDINCYSSLLGECRSKEE